MILLFQVNLGCVKVAKNTGLFKENDKKTKKTNSNQPFYNWERNDCDFKSEKGNAEFGG